MSQRVRTSRSLCETVSDLDRQKKVSIGGGTEPIWSASGQELFYRSGNKMMVVDVQPGGVFSTPVILFDEHFAVDPVGNDAANYDVRLDENSSS